MTERRLPLGRGERVRNYEGFTGESVERSGQRLFLGRAALAARGGCLRATTRCFGRFGALAERRLGGPASALRSATIRRCAATRTARAQNPVIVSLAVRHASSFGYTSRLRIAISSVVAARKNPDRSSCSASSAGIAACSSSGIRKLISVPTLVRPIADYDAPNPLKKDSSIQFTSRSIDSCALHRDNLLLGLLRSIGGRS